MVSVSIRVHNIYVMILSKATDHNSLVGLMRSTSGSLVGLARGHKVVNLPIGNPIEEHLLKIHPIGVLDLRTCKVPSLI